MNKKLIIGTRGSRLAILQAEEVRDALLKAWGNQFEFEIKAIKTTGDNLQKMDITAKPPKGFFTKEIELELADGKIDLGVHSCKDLPTEISDEFCIAAVTKRISARDVLVLKEDLDREHLPNGIVVLTGSPRRQSQWLMKHPQMQVEAVRGNVDTRIRKLLENEEWHGLILAEAGLLRLNPSLKGIKIYPFSFDEMLPAPGQGSLVVETRRKDICVREIVAKINDEVSERCVMAEREFLAEMGGGCRSPIAAYAEITKDGGLKLQGIVFNKHGGHRDSVEGGEGKELGRILAGRLKKFI